MHTYVGNSMINNYLVLNFSTIIFIKPTADISYIDIFTYLYL